VNKRKSPYRQGVVKVSTHPSLLQGQVIEIIEENAYCYKVRVFINGKIETIEKSSVLVN
jgi:hypothetical protein